MTTSESSPFVRGMAEEFASFLTSYLAWHDRYQERERAARDAAKARGGRILSGGPDGPWLGGQCKETYYDDETGEKLGVVIWEAGDLSTPLVSTMQFRDGDVHVDSLVSDEMAVFDGPDPFGFAEWADAQNFNELRARWRNFQQDSMSAHRADPGSPD